MSLFPYTIGKWRVVGEEVLKPEVIKLLGVDDYIWRKYSSKDGMIVDLYVGYFSYVDRIKTYHSPLNCMPGSGWNIYGVEAIPIRLGPHKEVNVSLLTLKNGAKTIKAIYWYQGRGRIIASDYTERIYRILDSISRGRTDGAFVRIIDMSDKGDIKELKDFSKMVVNILNSILPS